MTTVSIVYEVFQKIPARARFGMLVTFAGIVVVEQLLRIWEVQLDYDKIDQTLVYVGGYLGIQSAANVPLKKKRVRDADPE